jgi:hypothetical protein
MGRPAGIVAKEKELAAEKRKASARSPA